jgi:uncharacterized protein (UPF0335 family)
LLLTFVAAGGIYYLYQRERVTLDAGYARQEEKLDKLRVNNRLLRERIESLEEEKSGLHERIANLERGRQVDTKAYAKVDEHLQKLQSDNLALREELAFYRGIVSSDGHKGISIQTFVVERDGPAGAYRYSLVLTRNMRNGKVASGTIDLLISGEMDGRIKQLDLKDVSRPASRGLSFEFKHFQRLEGRVQLPRGFVPHRVYVKVHTAGDRPSSLEKTFDWSRAAS